MSVSVSRDKGPFTVGDNISITIKIRNLSMTPRSWIDVEDITDIPDLRFRLITSFGSLVAFKNKPAKVVSIGDKIGIGGIAMVLFCFGWF